uniref:Cilia- and flagella-associated protein 47 domain-containing protein n=1 Tax=Scophthalmus maximus TaxID=52904 RepID=A0A8D2ZDD0_SCOMX
MARHRSEQQIVLKTGNVHTNKHRCTKYGMYSRLSSSDSFADSDSVSSQTSREEEVWSNRRTLANVGIPEFPTADSDEGRYHQSVLLAVERWFSLFGWPNGPHPISVPHTLRRYSPDPPSLLFPYVCQSVVDMLHHLTGKQIPGIPRSGSFSTDIDKRTAELLQHSGVTCCCDCVFRVQGACLWHIKPEYLLDMQEFKHWCSLQVRNTYVDATFKSRTFNSLVDYESLSKRSWTDVLLQIYKVKNIFWLSFSSSITYYLFILSLPLYLSLSPFRAAGCFVPSARWIVNFDLDLTDGLVLAALLAAYCPYLICSHFRRMYTAPSSLEQILHNNIVVVRSLTALSLNMDIQDYKHRQIYTIHIITSRTKIQRRQFVTFHCSIVFFLP